MAAPMARSAGRIRGVFGAPRAPTEELGLLSYIVFSIAHGSEERLRKSANVG
jgi:hypothetical protein